MRLMPVLAAWALLLAGCATPGPAPAPSTVGPDILLDAGSSLGVIAGVVVDEAIRPLDGAAVTMAGAARNLTTEGGGLFAFEALEPGTYFLTASAPGHDRVQTSVEVWAGEISRVRILLQSTGVVQGYHQTLHFEGYIEASAALTGPILNIILDEFGDNPFCRCTLAFNTTGLDVRTLVVEAVWEDTLADPRGPTDLYLEVFPRDVDELSDIQGGFKTSPVLEHYPITAWGENETHTEWRARLSGSAEHVNYSQTYDLFVTIFVNEPAPPGWSLVQGDT